MGLRHGLRINTCFPSKMPTTKAGAFSRLEFTVSSIFWSVVWGVSLGTAVSSPSSFNDDFIIRIAFK